MSKTAAAKATRPSVLEGGAMSPSCYNAGRGEVGPMAEYLIGEFAKHTGMSPKLLKYYESERLLTFKKKRCERVQILRFRPGGEAP